MDFALTTGDNADNQQYNENVWVRQLLEGGATLSPNSGVEDDYNECSAISDAALTLRDWFGERAEPIYTGVQDFGTSPPTRDLLGPEHAAGHLRGLAEMDRPDGPRAAVVHAAGLRRGAALLPSNVANGNHDGLVQATRRRARDREHRA